MNIGHGSTWTQGPWQPVNLGDVRYIGAPRPGNSARLDDVLGDPNAEANASLIAAAPDLYEAAKAALCAIEAGEGYWDAQDKLEAAIAKARGIVTEGQDAQRLGERSE